MVTVERYVGPLEAELARGRLDSAGIPSFLVGENAAILYGSGLGGLQLQVRSQDEADARRILDELSSGDLVSDTIDAEDSDDTD